MCMHVQQIAPILAVQTADIKPIVFVSHSYAVNILLSFNLVRLVLDKSLIRST